MILKNLSRLYSCEQALPYPARPCVVNKRLIVNWRQIIINQLMNQSIPHASYRNFSSFVIGNDKFSVIALTISAFIQILKQNIQIAFHIVRKIVKFKPEFFIFSKLEPHSPDIFKLKSMMESLPIISKTYEMYKDIIVINNQLQKRMRNTLGASLEDSSMEYMECLIMAKNAPKTLMVAYLIKASCLLKITAIKLRLFLELNLSNETKIFQTQTKMTEIGRILGGWLKASQST